MIIREKQTISSDQEREMTHGVSLTDIAFAVWWESCNSVDV
jgi:hypothetical protein